MIRLFIFSFLVLVFRCQPNVDSSATVRLISSKQDTVSMDISVLDTVEYCLGDVLSVRIKQELLNNKVYLLNFRMRNCFLDTMVISRIQSGNIVLDHNGYEIDTILPKEEKKLILRFYARAPIFSKELIVFYKNGEVRKSTIRLKGRAKNTE